MFTESYLGGQDRQLGLKGFGDLTCVQQDPTGEYLAQHWNSEVMVLQMRMLRSKKC